MDGAIIRNVFDFGSIRDTEILFDACIKKSTLRDNPVCEIHYHRVTMIKTPDRHVYLDFFSLGFVEYIEQA